MSGRTTENVRRLGSGRRRSTPRVRARALSWVGGPGGLYEGMATDGFCAGSIVYSLATKGRERTK